MAASSQVTRTLLARLARRARRGAELVEFIMVFPVFLFLFFGIMEFSWYFYQRSIVIEATREGCQAGAESDPEEDDFAQIAADVIVATLGSKAGIQCDEPQWTCSVVIGDLHDDPPNHPSRLTCDVQVNYVSLTGFLGSDDNPGGPGGDMAAREWGGSSGNRLIPQFLNGHAAAVFEGAN
ncbi:MAG: pilus assembly protein [Alphaproteobacteria bacterium]|nr:pilus assembly protein [Alphaproteobacteria bacterium]